ncbi:hypothetical protein J4558_08155 [Leptolyngbya sp. 15MV]|nr:hypothetical protein J4558_08155 [Leptolyngbya sp. 15MV]
MPEAYIIDAVRTPIGRKKGSLAHLHPADLGAHPIKALVERTGIDPGAVDDVVWGCCDTIGPQAGDIGRTVWLVAGLPQHVPGTTVDRQCGSSQQALHFAAQGVMSGTQDLVVAGGSQAMNAIPISAAMYAGELYGFANPFNTSPGWVARYGDGLLNQISSAQMIADKWDIGRAEMEAFALASHQRAQAATEAGWFAGEIAPLEGLDRDETIRPGTTLDGLAALNPVAEGGTITAGVASQNCDGDQGGLVLALDLDGDLVGLLPLAGALLDQFEQLPVATDALAGADRGDEARLVAAVVDAHLHAIGLGQVGIGAEVGDHRQGQEPVRDGAAERRHLGHFLVDVDELVVARRLGELVNPLLAHLDPFAGADVLADLGCDFLRCHAPLLCRESHGNRGFMAYAAP